jgi:hypothetical protein
MFAKTSFDARFQAGASSSVSGQYDMTTSEAQPSRVKLEHKKSLNEPPQI